MGAFDGLSAAILVLLSLPVEEDSRVLSSKGCWLLLLLFLSFIDLLRVSSSCLARASRSRASSSRVFRLPLLDCSMRALSGSSSYSDSDASAMAWLVTGCMGLGERSRGAGGGFLEAFLKPVKEAALAGGLMAGAVVCCG